MHTEPDHYSLLSIADVTSFLLSAKIFSKLDLLKGYYQVPVHPKDIQKTTVTTSFGTFTFNYSCFGSKAATIGFPSTDSSRHTFQTMTPTYCTTLQGGSSLSHSTGRFRSGGSIVAGFLTKSLSQLLRARHGTQL